MNEEMDLSRVLKKIPGASVYKNEFGVHVELPIHDPRNRHVVIGTGKTFYEAFENALALRSDSEKGLGR